MTDNTHHQYNSISELHSLLNLKKPSHPLVSVINLEEMDTENGSTVKSIEYNFYALFLKKNFDGKIKYGHQYYDFDNGVMTFFAPKQRVIIEDYTPTKLEGWMLIFHPDFLQGYPITKKIKEYGFFSYATNEALHVSDKEDDVISGIMKNLQTEIEAIIDGYTQDVVISHIELLLNYCNRFYNRQFITRKKASNDLLVRFEDLLSGYLQNDKADKIGIPSVQYLADKLFISPNYLNDLLKNLTGQTTQQHIQNFLINKAKDLLTTTNLSVSEIAYQLGFEYPQSFNKLFKNKTHLTPLEFKQSFN
ncbi:AraC family transcriptional regulator [Flavobacterium zhairuonense]|uniref:helix-turn-helix domain-containing protein n=1 Tax=Flavobacterium zhairuonense TaxID=2493631 RepID=UPI00104B989C|nr:helix-turn-helix transcriptional regulator [Flavobacterium zhairuonense]KAF2506907.1 AraC family transcriptional regulator [Flavobacterium zhairuonense]